MFIVYILQSLKTGFYYTGITNDLNRRLLEHNSNLNDSTKNKGPWQLVYSEVVSSRAKARRKEKFLKSGYGRECRRLILSR
jgi:putative endonuclease